MARANVAQCLHSVHVLQTRMKDDARVVELLAGIGIVLDRCGDIERDAAERVDDLLKSREIDDRVVVDLDPEVIFDRRAHQPRTTNVGYRSVGVGGVDLFLTDAGNVDQQVTRNRHEPDLLRRRVDRHDDDRVGEGNLPLFGAGRVGVGAEEQDIDSLLLAPVG